MTERAEEAEVRLAEALGALASRSEALAESRQAQDDALAAARAAGASLRALCAASGLSIETVRTRLRKREERGK